MDGPDGTLVPPDYAKAVDKLMEECRRLPGRCQARLDGQWVVCDALVDSAILVERADCLGARVDDRLVVSSRWPPWQVAVVAIAMAAVAGGVGYMAGRLAP